MRTTNKGADNITGEQYAAFEQVIIAPSGLSFSINTSGKFNNDRVMATIDLGK